MRVDFGYAEKKIKTGYCGGEDRQPVDWTYGRDDDARAREGDA
jgi:hypothetical protein